MGEGGMGGPMGGGRIPGVEPPPGFGRFGDRLGFRLRRGTVRVGVGPRGLRSIPLPIAPILPPTLLPSLPPPSAIVRHRYFWFSQGKWREAGGHAPPRSPSRRAFPASARLPAARYQCRCRCRCHCRWRPRQRSRRTRSRGRRSGCSAARRTGRHAGSAWMSG